MNEMMMKTLVRGKAFRVTGSLAGGVRIRFEKGRAVFGAGDWEALRQRFGHGNLVSAGTSRTVPPTGSLGAFLLESHGVNHASYLLPVMEREGWVRVYRQGNKLIFRFVK